MRRALLGGLIDHAPLFPPASLAMDAAVAADRRARASELAWMLGRFAVPLSRLGELPAGFDVRLSLIVDVDGPVPDDPRVETVEARAGRAAQLHGVAARTFVEVRPGEALPEGAAKVRCGGEAVPSVAELAAFVAACRDAGKPFKATAGLHDPLRADGRHGFLNLLAAAVFAAEVGERELAALLAEEDPAAFSLDDASFEARGRSAGVAEVTAGRRFFVGYGSCSFDEPVAGLRALGML